MESVKRANQRLYKDFPKLLVSCSEPASLYVKCVARHMGDIQKDACKTEFIQLQECIRKQAKKK